MSEKDSFAIVSVNGVIVESGDVPNTINEAFQAPADDDPAVGKWYWVADKEPWLGCIVHAGSNYFKLEGVQYSNRIHVNNFWDKCVYEPNPERVINDKILGYQKETQRLMMEVRDVTARLAITPSPALQAASNEPAAMVIATNDQPIEEYKAALIKAKTKVLPDLFQAIKESNTAMGVWMKAQLIPLQAQATSMGGTIKLISDRIFSVELYSGLVESVKLIADGEPAPVGEKIRLLQRRHYMDEECLAHYEVGGMDFRNIEEFDKWLTSPKMLSRILPFDRCIVAFQVRRNTKYREVLGIHDFLQVIEMEKADQWTFLYLRNGEKVYRLNTGIEFGEKLFPDLDQQVLDKGRLIYAKGTQTLTEHQYLGMVEDENREIAEWEEAKRTDPKSVSSWPPQRESERYKPWTRDNVQYDDIAETLAEKFNEHNRLVLVLQGLLDRSPVFQPHPMWQLYTGAGFRAGLELVYDDSRALVPGEAPDFEAYRTRLNAQIKEGSVTIGQEIAWEELEAEKEGERRRRTGGRDYYPERFRPYGDPGPGKLARVKSLAPRAGKVTYEWERARRTTDEDGKKKDGSIRRTFTTTTDKVFNIDAYTPGDFRLFFNDPRTRADYLEWAPFMLEAEEYHAGNRKDQYRLDPLPPPKPKVHDPDAAYRYQKRKELKSFLGKAVRLRRDVTMKSGKIYKAGTLWRVSSQLDRGKLNISGILKDGSFERPLGEDGVRRTYGRERAINGMSPYDLDKVEGIPDEPKPPPKEDDDES